MLALATQELGIDMGAGPGGRADLVAVLSGCCSRCNHLVGL